MKNLTINQFNQLFNKLEWHVDISNNYIVLYQLINTKKVEKIRRSNIDNTVPPLFFNLVQQYNLK